ncbi:hypothetical protein BC835DRAFT_1416775 [Cytidiella melzeri]|nr:hypothetical protein BC835DRAFT_1416775 [Cytidiella melzeri]
MVSFTRVILAASALIVSASAITVLEVSPLGDLIDPSTQAVLSNGPGCAQGVCGYESGSTPLNVIPSESSRSRWVPLQLAALLPGRFTYLYFRFR